MFALPVVVLLKTVRFVGKGVRSIVSKVWGHAPRWQSMAIPRLALPMVDAEARSIEPASLEAEEVSFHTRNGDGFKVVFHLRLESHRIQPVVWLDFMRLSQRLGKEVAEDMQSRLGQLPAYATSSGRRPHWGRLQLPEVYLHVRSSREARARQYMWQTVDAVDRLIREGGRQLVCLDGESLPKGDAATVPEAQSSLPLSAPEVRGASASPKKSRPDVICIGTLVESGLTERRNPSTGETYQVFYADIDLGGGRRSRQTGRDLERALNKVDAVPGQRLRLEQLGTAPVKGGQYRKKIWNATVLEF